MTRLERRLLWWSTGVVALTGLAYAGFEHLMTPPDEFAVVNHPLQPVMLKLHIIAAPFLVFALGQIATRHIWAQLRGGGHRGRRTGTFAALVIGPMIVTGYLIQAVTQVGLLAALAWSHLVLGTAFALVAAAHSLAARRGRQRDATSLCGACGAHERVTGSRRVRRSRRASAA